MIRVNWTADDRLLRRFGWIWTGGFLLIGWVVSCFVPESEVEGVWLVSGALSLACGLLALFSPGNLKPIYLLVTGVGVVIFFPFTLILRIFGVKAAVKPFAEAGENFPDDGDSD